MELFTYEADELLNEAIMSDTPIVIVEGTDDIPLYEDLIKSLNKNIEVYASENLIISGNISGCVGVVNSLNKINEFSQNINIEKYILGIIDKDVKDFRGEIVEIKGLFVLKYYSIESHFVIEDNIAYIISQFTNASISLLEKMNLHSQLFNEIVENMSIDLYYITLDALKNACESNYISLYKYSDKIIRILNTNYSLDLSTRICELNSFAMDKNIQNDFNNLLLIVKGKWLLEYFVLKIKSIIENLSNKCSNERLCQFCQNTHYEQCSFKVLFKCDIKTIKTLLLKNTSIASLDYIKEKISTLVS